MPSFSVRTFRTGLDGARTRVYTMMGRQPSVPARLAVGAAAVIIFGLFLVLLIPALLISAGVGLLAAAAYSVRRALRASRAPNGVLDGRRNVRVVVRDNG